MTTDGEWMRLRAALCRRFGMCLWPRLHTAYQVPGFYSRSWASEDVVARWREEDGNAHSQIRCLSVGIHD